MLGVAEARQIIEIIPGGRLQQQGHSVRVFLRSVGYVSHIARCDCYEMGQKGSSV